MGMVALCCFDASAAAMGLPELELDGRCLLVRYCALVIIVEAATFTRNRVVLGPR